MSRKRESSVEILGYQDEMKSKIIEFANCVSNYLTSDWYLFCDRLIGKGMSRLRKNESEQEFAERLACEIFKANGQPCRINVAVDLKAISDPKYNYEVEYLEFNEMDYERLIKPVI